MTRTLAHALHELALKNKWNFDLWSAYDKNRDLLPQYLPAEKFKGFGRNRPAFVLNMMIGATTREVIIISHVNLALVGLLTKFINPKCRVWLIAHGIEVWRPLSFLQTRFLKLCDKIICVSNFTRQQMIIRHQVSAARCEVLNNAVDSFIKLPENFFKPQKLLTRYQLTGAEPVIFTLSRLASTEQYKWHDQVIKVLSKLKGKFPGIKYILSGQYDHDEKVRIEKLIAAAGVGEQVILTGFIDESEFADYFLLADLFVLPSKKEGFGIVFIEAMAYGLPVICGNADGSSDAICNGELCKAVNADDPAELENAISGYLDEPLTAAARRRIQRKCLLHFNERDYIKKLEELLVR